MSTVQAARRRSPGARSRTQTPDRERARSRPPVPQQGVAPVAEVGTHNVRVVCRLRPMDEREKKLGAVPAVTASTERKEVAAVRGTGARQARCAFHFDAVLGSYSTQDEVFNATLRPLVCQVLEGFEATAFAYGQTGTGKTYTMEGDADSEECRGLMPRAAASVLEALGSGRYLETEVTVSYLEIYNEELSDLLASPQQQHKLELMDTGGTRGVCCVNLSEVPVSSLSDILDLVRIAQERRRVAETRVNARSSRSHCIFTMKVRSRRSVAAGEIENVGKLHLVDLAGSECAKKAAWGPEDATAGRAGQATTEQERERRSINQSLLTLGRVIAALREGTGRVPYRDSKLTRLLKDALGGSCKTVLIATISPALTAVEETISTLTYAEQAAGIMNRPVASSLLRTVRLPSGGDSGTSISGCGATDWAELEMKVAYLSAEVEEAQAALARKYQEAQEMTERAERAEEEIVGVREELTETRRLLEDSRVAHADAAAGLRALAGELANGVAASTAAQECLSAELAGLKEQRAFEQRMVAELARQREALQAEIANAQVSLQSSKVELSSIKAEVDELRSSQEQSRGVALRAIMELANDELDKLGRGLDAGANEASGRLDAATTMVEAVGQSILAAEAQSVVAGCQVAETAASWSKEAAMWTGRVAQHSEEAARVTTTIASAATERLRELEASSAKWAAKSYKVTQATDEFREAKENADVIVPDGKMTKGKEMDLEVGRQAGVGPHRAALREVNA